SRPRSTPPSWARSRPSASASASAGATRRPRWPRSAGSSTAERSGGLADPAGADEVFAPIAGGDRVFHHAVRGGRDRRFRAQRDADVRGAGAGGVEEDEVAGLDFGEADFGAGFELGEAGPRQRDPGLAEGVDHQARAVEGRGAGGAGGIGGAD